MDVQLAHLGSNDARSEFHGRSGPAEFGLAKYHDISGLAFLSLHFLDLLAILWQIYSTRLQYPPLRHPALRTASPRQHLYTVYSAPQNTPWSPCYTPSVHLKSWPPMLKPASKTGSMFRTKRVTMRFVHISLAQPFMPAEPLLPLLPRGHLNHRSCYLLTLMLY